MITSHLYKNDKEKLWLILMKQLSKKLLAAERIKKLK
jgi:hypothetical protein